MIKSHKYNKLVALYLLGTIVDFLPVLLELVLSGGFNNVDSIPVNDMIENQTPKTVVNSGADLPELKVKTLDIIDTQSFIDDLAYNLSQLSRYNAKKSVSSAGENIEPKFYQVDPNQPKVNNYATESTADNQFPNLQEQKEKPQISSNLSDYINELVGENIYQEFIRNKASTSIQPDVPIYPEDGVIKGGISRTYIPEKDKKILSQSGGYITPTKASRDFDNFDKTNIWLNNKMNKDAYDAKQMLEIGIYGVDSYDDNDQFKHIQDGSGDLYNEKYKLVGNKTIPSDMKGIEFSKDSDFSKRISENTDFFSNVVLTR